MHSQNLYKGTYTYRQTQIHTEEKTYRVFQKSGPPGLF